MFDIIIDFEQSISCITPKGRIDTVNSQSFEKAVMPLAEKEHHMIIDFSHCNYLSSTCIRVLLAAFKKLKAKNGWMIFSSVSPEIYQIFEMTGLHKVFSFSENRQKAVEEIEKIKQKEAGSCEWMLDKHKVIFHPTGSAKQPALIWKNPGIAGYNELGLSVGTGIAADPLEEAVDTEGLFITTGNAAGFIPNNTTIPPDFRIFNNPSQAGVLVNKALSFGKSATGWFRIFEPSAVTLAQLAGTIYKNRQQVTQNQLGVMALLTANFNTVSPTISFCVIIDNQTIDLLKEHEFQEFPGIINLSEKEGISLWGAKFVCDELKKPSDNPSHDVFLKEVLTLENILNIEAVDAEEPLSYPLAWLFVADKFDDASSHRILLETPSEGFSEPYKAFLTRRLYNDSVRVAIKPLHGGYSAQTFQVNSFDKEGRRLRPTVLKIANRAMITREADRCKKYSLPYILNNSAMVLGTEFFGDYGALCYNFVGIGGEQTQLKWLTNYYDEWPVEKLKPIFDKTFLQILNPWYGQPVKEKIYPFKDHDPTFTFFPHLFDVAENVLSVSPEEPSIKVSEINRTVVNPYWFLKYEYERRRNTFMDYYTAICHGDLNMQNILIDQDMNVYLIDFSETRPRSVISDFARLEAIFMVERAPLSDETEISAMIEFVQRFYSISQLDHIPDNSYEGKRSDVVNKNVEMARKMRSYAIKNSSGETTIVPYYIAMLEWVLPIVCFSCTPVHKRFSMIVAGLLCEKVIELIKE